MSRNPHFRTAWRSTARRGGGALAVVALAAAVLVSGGSRPATAATTPEVAIGSVVVTEGDVGSEPAMLTVSLSSSVRVDTNISYVVLDGTATSPSDYRRAAGRVRIRAGRTLATIRARIFADRAAEGDETFSVVLTRTDGAPIAHPIGIVTIRDDDPMAAGRLAIGDASVYEGDATRNLMRFTVTLDAPARNDVTARYATFGGTAAAGVDFSSRAGTLRIRAGRTSAVVSLKTIGDTSVEGTEQLQIRLSAVVGAVPTDAIAIGTVLDDDPSLIMVPGAPTLTSAVAGPANGMLTVAWSAPTSDGGSDVTGYELEITRPAGPVVGSYSGMAASVVCGAPGVTCGLRVRALNIVGPGAWSDPIDGTTWRAPGAVDGLTPSGGNNVVSAFWSTPADAGDFPILDYRIERSTDGTNFTFVEFTSFRAATVSCPGERATCWVRVRARNAAGLGAASEANATTWARPSSPTLVTIRRIGTLVGLGWEAPADDGGTAVFEYTGERTIDGGVTWTPIGSVQFVAPTCPVGISCGFRISAVNAVGASAPSNPMTVEP